jgi:hypothetical protein
MSRERNRRARRAFTFVESALWSVLASMLFILLAGMARHARLSLSRGEDGLDARARGVRALSELRAGLADAWAYEVGRDGTGLIYVTPAGSAGVSHDPASATLALEAPDRRNLPDRSVPGVTKVTIEELFPGTLRVTLEIARRPPEPSFILTDEVSMPAYDRARSPVPWNYSMDPRTVTP